jgi:hypothetical protein
VGDAAINLLLRPSRRLAWPTAADVGSAVGRRGIWGSCCGSLSNAQTPYPTVGKALV